MEHSGQIEQLMLAYFQGCASSGEVARLEEWVSMSDENYRQYQQFKNIWEAEHPCFDPAQVLRAKDADGRRLKSRMTGRSLANFWMKVSAVLLLPVAAISVWLALENREYKQDVRAF